jgi:hypothetical protein
MKGQLLRAIPYVISGKNTKGMKVSINELSGLKSGDRVYQKKLDNGAILIIPEKIYEESGYS